MLIANDMERAWYIGAVSSKMMPDGRLPFSEHMSALRVLWYDEVRGVSEHLLAAHRISGCCGTMAI